MNITVEGTGAGSLPAAAISNVENFFIRDVAGAGSAYDFGSIQGEQQVWSNTSTNTGGVDFQNLGTGATVGLKGNNVLNNLSDVSFNMAAAADAVSIAIDGGVKDGSAGGGTLTKITASAGTATEATVSSSGAANTVGAVTLSGGTNTVKTLTVNATTNLTAALVANDFAADAKLVVTGEGKVSLGANFDGNTIDASANSGGLTISTTAGVTKSLIGSSAADTISLVGALASAGTVDLGAGNDKLLDGGSTATVASNNTVDGGAGFDTVSASIINAANAAQFKNFEALDLSASVTNLDVELMTGSAIEALTLSGDGGAATTAQVSNVATGVGLKVSGDNATGGSTTINVKGAATATDNSFAITFEGAAVAGAAATAANVKAGTVVLNEIETLSIASEGGSNTWNSIAVTDNKLQTLTITGDKNLDLTFVGTNGTNPVATQGGGVKLIDGSAATGKLSINTTNVTADDKAGVGLTVNGGSAADSITLAQKATVSAGAGNDTIVSAATGGTFTGGAGNDKFDVALATATAGTEAGAILTTVTDFAAGDSAKLLGTATSFTNTKLALDSSVQNLVDAITLATATANVVTWFQFGANTYVVSNDGDVGFDGGELVVKLTGLVDLTNATLDTTSDYLTLA